MMKFLFLLCFTFVLARATPQDSLWLEIQKAEKENRVSDAILLLQEANQFEGPYSEEIQISLEAYAAVLGIPEILEIKASSPSMDSDVSISFSWNGYGGLYEQDMVVEPYQETFLGSNASLMLEYTWESKSIVQSVYLSGSVDEYVPIGASGSGASDSSLASSYTLIPTLGYSVVMGDFIFGFNADYLLIQEEDPSLAFQGNLGYALWRKTEMHLGVSASAYKSLAYNDQYSVRITASRMKNHGLKTNVSLGYLLNVDSVSTPDATTRLIASYAGPDLGGKLGYRFAHAWLESRVSYGLYSATEADQWSGLRYTKKQSKSRVALQYGYLISPSLSLYIEGVMTTQKYLDMPTTHPDFNQVKTTTWSLVAGIDWNY